MLPGLTPRLNRRSAVLVTAPAVEPVSLADVKTYLKIDGTEEDNLLPWVMATARRLAEEYTGRAFITQTWRLTQDSFSGFAETVPPTGVMLAPTPHLVSGEQVIHLPRGPIQSVTDIKTTGSAGAETTVPSSVYALDVVNGDVRLGSGQAWPTDLREFSAVAITFKAGYGDTADKVPQDIRQAVLMQTAAMYENRACTDLSPGVTTILDPYRLPEVFGIW